MTPSHLIGCILGTAVGDALGLPYEGISPRRAAKLLGPPSRYRLLFGRGMVSDDTEHTCMVAQSLIASGLDVDSFRRDLAWRLRLWLLALPAGTGLATLRSILRLWIGFSPDRSGVFSAGNGPAMRATILGASVDDHDLLRQLVRASTRITHTDPKAEYGALAVALAAQMARQSEIVSGEDYLSQLRALLHDEAEHLQTLIASAVKSVSAGEPTLAFARSMGLGKGVSGYIYHTVPVVLHAWLTYPRDFRSAVTTVIECGGDADSTAAILGGIVGTAVGKEGIPEEWLSRLWEWPRTVAWMEALACTLASSLESATAQTPPRVSFLGVLARNLVFLAVVLFHGFRRLLPPW